MTTVLKIINGGTFMVGGPRYEHGTLIISIKPIAPMGSADAGTSAAAAASTSPPAVSAPPAAPASDH